MRLPRTQVNKTFNTVADHPTTSTPGLPRLALSRSKVEGGRQQRVADIRQGDAPSVRGAADRGSVDLRILDRLATGEVGGAAHQDDSPLLRVDTVDVADGNKE